MAKSNLDRTELTRVLSAPSGDHSFGNGLYLRVRNGAASWVFRRSSPVHKGKRPEIGLGSACRNNPAQRRVSA